MKTQSRAVTHKTIRAAFLRASGAALLVGATAGAQTPDQHHLFTFRGVNALDFLGSAVAPIGDFDLDGHRDILVGAPQSHTGTSGYARIHSGENGTVLLTLEGQPTTDSMGDRFGAAIAALGDVTDDGFIDFAVSAPRQDEGGLRTGSVHVYSGQSGMLLHSFSGANPGDELGARVAAAGDVNGDGHGDVLCGAPGGQYVRVFSGEWITKTSQAQAPVGPEVLYAFSGIGGFGEAVTGLGDVNRDSIDDFAVGSPGEADLGAVRIYSGNTGAVLATIFGVASGDLFGRSVGHAGDVNLDGSADLLIGAPGDDGNGDGAGVAHLISGRWIEEVGNGLTPTGPQVFALRRGDSPGDGLGFDVSCAGDVDMDGRPDWIAGANGSTSLTSPGYARVVSGADGTTLFDVVGSQTGEMAGWTVRGGADFDEDGHADLIVGRPYTGVNATGSVQVLSGRSRSFAADTHELNVTTGGTMNMSLEVAPTLSGHFYIILGTASGTSPGFPSNVGTLPINLDAYTTYTLVGSPELAGFQGLVDPSGEGSAQILMAPDSPANLVGFNLHYAFFTLDITKPGIPTTHVSNALPLSFTIDACDVIDPMLDCDGNGVLDACDIADGIVTDCDQNGRPDSCDIADGIALDVDLDGIPDGCTTRVYVDADAPGAGDGTSWASAYRDLRVAIASAPEFSQVWVADGTYTPWPTTGNPGSSFVLRDTVGVYGGFDGTETSFDQRDWVANVTVLSGDVDGNDGPNFVNYEENSWSIVTAPLDTGTSAILDGFTVRGGNAHETVACDVFAVYFTSCRGGGLYALGSPTVRNCIFEDNAGGHHGGAVFNLGSGTTLANCTFRRNQAFQGGALYNDLGATTTVVNCDFVGNGALKGGAVYIMGNPSDTPHFINCLFADNDVSDEGGAIYAQDVNLTLTNCTITDNNAWLDGGGLYATPGATTTVVNSILWANTDGGPADQSAQLQGGALSATHCCIQGGDAGLAGGGGNFDLDPLFFDPDGPDDIPGNLDDDFRLAAGSPCIDAGLTTALPADVLDVDRDGDSAEAVPLDLDLTSRVVDDPVAPDVGIPGPGGEIVDLGAFER